MHGSYGSPDSNWFRYLESELIQRNHDVILQQFPVDSWDTVEKIGPNALATYKPIESLASWEAYFKKCIVPRIEGKSIGFIGHSIAPIFMLHMLTKYNFQLNKAIFVAPFFSIPDSPTVWQFYPVNKTFYSYDFNFEKIREKITESHVVYGDNDPYVPSGEPPLFSQKLHSKVHVVQNGLHCGSNFHQFPLLLTLL
jgi:predicted alpha/beta hydrolase family esterase